MIKMSALCLSSLVRYAILLLGIFLASSVYAGDDNPPTFHDPVELHGYAWSDTVGWISFNCDNEAAAGCNLYKVEIEPDYDLVGYAWSSNVGWIKFGGLVLGATQASGGQARINAARDALEGWARACAATANGACSGALAAEGGGWDGWVSFNRNNHGSGPNYAIEVGNNGDFVSSASSYAWGGGTVIGWVDFSVINGVTFDQPCDPVATAQCNASFDGILTYDQWCEETEVLCNTAGGEVCVPNPSPSCEVPNIPYTLTVNQPLVRGGDTVNVTWNVDPTDASVCEVVSNNGSSWNTLSGTETSNSIIRQTTTFTLSCSPLGGGPLIELGSVDVTQVANLIET